MANMYYTLAWRNLQIEFNMHATNQFKHTDLHNEIWDVMPNIFKYKY